MSKDLRPLGTKDLEGFRTDPDGNLYWKGKQIRTGGLTTADRIALGSAIVAVLALLAGIAKDYKEILENLGPPMTEDSVPMPPDTLSDPSPAPASPLPDQ